MSRAMGASARGTALGRCPAAAVPARGDRGNKEFGDDPAGATESTPGPFEVGCPISSVSRFACHQDHAGYHPG